MSFGKLLFSLFLSLCFATSSFASLSFASSEAGLGVGSFAPARSIASISSGSEFEAKETELAAEIDRQADVVFKDFVATSGSRVPFSVLKKAQRAAVYRLKQMYVLTDILKASGPAPATTIIATELLTNFVLAPIATAFGKPAVAGVMLTVPWGLMAGFGVFTYQTMKARAKLARSLGLKSLKALNNLRELIIGYDLKYRVSSIIFRKMASDIGSVEFEVLQKGWNFSTSKMPAIHIAELEALVRSSIKSSNAGPNDSSLDGPSYLEQIYIERLDPSFYSALLLRFVNESEMLTTELVSLVRTRLTAIPASESSLSVRRHLLGIDDVQMQLDREIRNSQTVKAGLKKRVKSGELTELEAKRLRIHAGQELDRFREVGKRLSFYEYSVLLEAQAQLANDAALAMSDVEVSASRTSELTAIALETRGQSSDDFVLSEADVRPTAVEKIKAVLRTASAQSHAALSGWPLSCQDLF